MKRGQVTIYIILGLIILFIIGLIIFIQGRTAKEGFQQPVETGIETGLSPEFAVNYCFGKLSTEAVYILAKQGGYINPKGDHNYLEHGDLLAGHFYSDDAVVPYVVNGNTVNLRWFSDVLDYLARYAVVNMESCLDFSSAERQGYIVYRPRINWAAINFDYNKASVDYSSAKVYAEFFPQEQNEQLLLSAVYPVKLLRGDSVKDVSVFTVEVPLRLQKLYNLAGMLADMIAQSDDTFDVSAHCSELASYDNQVNIYTTENTYRQAHLITITDSAPVKIGLPPLRFQFAVRNKAVTGKCVG